MKKNLLFIFALTLFFACDKEKEDPAVSKTDLLSGGSQKTWYIYAALPDDRCASATDDSWIFSSNGTFEFNHGAIIEDEVNECSDFVNIEGTWKFENNEATLTIIALKEKGSTEDIGTLTLVQGEISVLTNERLVITYSTPSPSGSVEFRKR